ncbi:glycoside hydrolase family 28 protein [Xylariaceae sp. FL0804]|nr:glycoside hydrolase family 28 protein [Xylariaceae sp. FL0804]
MKKTLALALGLAGAGTTAAVTHAPAANNKTCSLTPVGGGGDDTPQLIAAFARCGVDGRVVVAPGDYNIEQVMDIANLSNVDIDIRGTLKWSSNISYWLANSLPVTYASLSTAWKISGEDIRIRGYGEGELNGNGQLWYNENQDGSNQPGRPIAFTLWHAKNVLVDGLKWRQSQFWHSFVAYSDNVTMTNLDMNSTSDSQWNTVNTDGVDTWNSNDVTIKNWTVTSGDDCISMKGNSTNIHVENAHCYQSGCAVIGSVGSDPSTPDYVENVIFKNITCTESSNAAWIKTYPGTGYVRNITFQDVYADNVDQPIYVTPCIYTGVNCDESNLPISDVRWINVTGTARYNVAAAIYCSASAPCANLTFEGVDLAPVDASLYAASGMQYLCDHLDDNDPSSSGIPCNRTCPADWPQQLSGPSNVTAPYTG